MMCQGAQEDSAFDDFNQRNRTPSFSTSDKIHVSPTACLATASRCQAGVSWFLLRNSRNCMRNETIDVIHVDASMFLDNVSGNSISINGPYIRIERASAIEAPRSGYPVTRRNRATIASKPVAIRTAPIANLAVRFRISG